MSAWQEIFGHDEPYDSQAEGIETAIETAEDRGVTVLEGACGTGKTMLALTAGIDRVRDPDSDYERVLVLTSVKQQLRQFETDLGTINANLPEGWDPISGLTLVGKADVCPYSRESAAGIDGENVYDRCETLREKTRTLVGDGGSTSASALTAESRSQQVGLADSGGTSARYLETAGEPAPYPPELLDYDDVEFCPFYSQYLDDLPEDGDAIEAVPFDLDEQGHLASEELVSLSVSYGTCPHSMMGALVPEVEVVVGNYYHAFDPLTTGSFTGALLDESTFLICDEAHMLEPRVRDLVSDGVGETTLRDAETELARMIQTAEMDRGAQRAPDRASGQRSRGETEDAALVREQLEDSDVTLAECKELRAFVADLREEIDRRIESHLDRERPGWKADPAALSDGEIPLRDPEVPGRDAISEWAEREGYDGGTWVRARSVGAIVERILNAAEDEERSRAAPAVGRLLGSWYRADHERYFREIELERTWDETAQAGSWRRAYTARLALFNCVPSDAIGDRLAEFGGGVLMSATLEPLDVFREVTGLDRLASDGRPVVERTVPLEFPAENRASFAVDAPKFTYGNRGDPDEETSGSVRRLYVDLLAEVAEHPGNVLVGMPNYAEAAWAAAELESRVGKSVLLDESSGDDATEELKRDFFGDGDKVLVTSLRGTLTEGVDYSGDRLSAAVVCGVPIINTASPRTRAVRTAYDRTFGTSGGQSGASASDRGFEYALTVPAVRKARQAIGRVIRGPDEVGVRVLLDARYARESWDGVREHFPEAEREEFQPVSPDMLELGLDRFRERH